MYSCFIRILLLLFYVPVALAQQEQTVQFQADEIIVDDKLGTITANGNVILVHKNYTLYTQTLVYNQKTHTLNASQHIRLELTNGETFLADSLRFSSDIREAFLKNIQFLFAQHGNFTGKQATLKNGTILRIQHGTYTACRLCQENPQTPLWQLHSNQIVRNKDTQQLSFYDLTLHMFGIPVFYLPYLSLPDPTVKRRSGLVDSSAGWHNQLGAFVTLTTYLNLHPQYDLTHNLTLYTQTTPLNTFHLRQRSQNGNIEGKSSITYSKPPLQHKKKQLRGHIQARTLFHLNDQWRTSTDLHWTSDPSFLQQYFNPPEQTFLKNQIVTEYFSEHDYLGIHALWFQSQNEQVVLDQPLILPLLTYTNHGKPQSLFNGTWSLHADARYILHSKNHQNIKRSNRISLEPKWYKTFTTPLGPSINLQTRLRIDVASATFNRTEQTSKKHKGYFRILPQATLDLLYPWYRSSPPWYHLIEPRVALFLTPTNTIKNFPNEDTLDVNQNPVSLFLPNRFTGTDVQEYGQRLSYGVQYTLKKSPHTVQIFFGQSRSRRLSQENSPLLSHTALQKTHSDYIGRIHLQLSDSFTSTYHLQLDTSRLHPTSQNLQLQFTKTPWSLKTHYTQTSTSTNAYGNPIPEEKFFSLDLKLPLTQYWKTHITYQHNLLPQTGPHQTSLQLSYEDECFKFGAGVKYNYHRSLTRRDDVTVLFSLSFKNAS